jgi:Arp2/3-interacting proteins Arpin
MKKTKMTIYHRHFHRLFFVTKKLDHPLMDINTQNSVFFFFEKKNFEKKFFCKKKTLMSSSSNIGASVRATSSNVRGAVVKEKGEGLGAYIEGDVVSWRYHSLHTGQDIHRYIAVQLQVTLARERTYDASGRETEPHHRAIKVLRKGYLVDSFEKVGGELTVVTLDKLHAMMGQGGSEALPAGYSDTKGLHPHVRGRFEVWGDTDTLKRVDMPTGAGIRVRTAGSSHFVESLARSDRGDFSNYSGGDVLNDWDSALQKHAEDSSDEEPLPGQDVEGAGDDAWDDNDDDYF